MEGISALISSLDPTYKEKLLRRCSANPGDLILFAVGPATSVNKTLDRIRVYVAHEMGLVDHVSLCLRPNILVTYISSLCPSVYYFSLFPCSFYILN